MHHHFGFIPVAPMIVFLIFALMIIFSAVKKHGIGHNGKTYWQDHGHIDCEYCEKARIEKEKNGR